MDYGPLEFVVIEFEGNRFRGEGIAALAEAVQNGTIRIIDSIFIIRDADGKVSVKELGDLEDESLGLFKPIVEDITNLFSESDIEIAAEGLSPNSSAAMLLFEHTWAKKLRDALVRANGRLVTGGLIPRDLLENRVKWLSEQTA
jgi:hypothetical protein